MVLAAQRGVDRHTPHTLLGPAITAAISPSSGNGVSGASQPCCVANARSAATFGRPINRARAMSRSESPWRKRTKTARYWNISILLRPTAALLWTKVREGSGNALYFEMPVLTSPGCAATIILAGIATNILAGGEESKAA